MAGKNHLHTISYVEEGSIAWEMDVEAGDVLVSINDETIEDIFDYRFLIQDEELLVVIQKPDGEEWELEIEKDADEDLGIEFEQGLMDDYRSCRNKCVFCFIDQMPPGMRKTLYFKDDDSRLSFLQGNYVTLTNMDDHDINRIIKYKLEPINISVQTTNPELRCTMLNNRFAGQSLAKIRTLYDAGILMNGQVVLCKNLNDRNELRRTLFDLLEYAPIMQSVSVVPVGLTKFREGLYPLEVLNKEDAEITLDIIKEVQQKALSMYGIHFAHASDELYILAERDLPADEEYDGYIQLENGVGMVRLMLSECEEEANYVKSLVDDGFINAEEVKCRISMPAGMLIYPYREEVNRYFTDIFPKLELMVYPIVNHFFGEQITVTGLITGRDLIEQLKDKDLGDLLLIPETMLKAQEEIFLDDVTVEEVEKTLQVKTHIVKSSVRSFTEVFLKGLNDE